MVYNLFPFKPTMCSMVKNSVRISTKRALRKFSRPRPRLCLKTQSRAVNTPLWAPGTEHAIAMLAMPLFIIPFFIMLLSTRW